MSAIIIGGFIWYFCTVDKGQDFQSQDARIKSIKQMVDLCTTDLHEEIAVKDSVNGKWIVARQTIEGRVRFNLDSLQIEQRGDTTLFYLPPERVEVLESAAPSSYRILDTWDASRRILSRTLTANEENVIKTRAQKNAVKRIYDRGYVKRARANAVQTLTPLFQALSGPAGKQGPVIIVDPTPDGVLSEN